MSGVRVGVLGALEVGAVSEVRTAPSFAALYAEAYVPMVRMAHLMTGSNTAAEELVQDAFVKVFKRFDALDNPGAYLRICVVNACRSWHRRRFLERTRGVAPAETASPPEHHDLLASLATLNQRQRAAVVLRFYEDLPEAEIAGLLGCRPGTVKSLLSRALDQLREVIER